MQFGKFNLIEKIGEGGLGEVFYAQNTAPNSFARDCVVKRVNQRLTSNPDFSDQFLEAAEQGCFLNHHNIAQNYEAGVIDDEHFISQEHIEGLNLEQVLNHHEQRLEAIPIEITLEIVLQVCEALTYAFWARDDRGRQLHMVHRNLKPSNIMVNKHGVVKVVDFGLVNAGQNMASGQGSMVLRMAAYMSPEQAKGEEVDNRSDIFSLGAIFYEMLTLKPLFLMDNPLQTLRMVQEGRTDEQLDALAQHPLGQGLLPLLKSMLGASPWDRPTEAKQLIPHLRTVLGHISQQIYLPTWIQEEIAAFPKPRKAKPALDTAPPNLANPMVRGTPAGRPVTPMAGRPGLVRPHSEPIHTAGSASGMPPSESAVARGGDPSAPVEYYQKPTSGNKTLDAAIDAVKGLSPKHLAIAASALGLLFIGLIALLSSGGGDDPEPIAQAATARLKLTSSPPGVQVFVPGSTMPRTTPFELAVPATSGFVDLRAQLEGFEPATARVLVVPNRFNQYNFVMEEIEDTTAIVEVHVYPPEGRLYLDGKLVEGIGPYHLKLEAERDYTLIFRAVGYAANEQIVKLGPSDVRKISMALDLLPETRFIDTPSE